MCSRIFISDEYLMFLFSLRVVADGDVGFKNLTYGFFAVSQWLNDKSKGYDAFDLAVFR